MQFSKLFIQHLYQGNQSIKYGTRRLCEHVTPLFNPLNKILNNQPPLSNPHKSHKWNKIKMPRPQPRTVQWSVKLKKHQNDPRWGNCWPHFRREPWPFASPQFKGKMKLIDNTICLQQVVQLWKHNSIIADILFSRNK